VTNDNDVVIKAWNTVLFDKFCRFKHLLIDLAGDARVPARGAALGALRSGFHRFRARGTGRTRD